MKVDERNCLIGEMEFRDFRTVKVCGQAYSAADFRARVGSLEDSKAVCSIRE